MAILNFSTGKLGFSLGNAKLTFVQLASSAGNLRLSLGNAKFRAKLNCVLTVLYWLKYSKSKGLGNTKCGNGNTRSNTWNLRRSLANTTVSIGNAKYSVGNTV